MKAAARARSERQYDADAHRYLRRAINTISSAAESIISNRYNPIQGRYWVSAPLLMLRPTWGLRPPEHRNQPYRQRRGKPANSQRSGLRREAPKEESRTGWSPSELGSEEHRRVNQKELLVGSELPRIEDACEDDRDEESREKSQRRPDIRRRAGLNTDSAFRISLGAAAVMLFPLSVRAQSAAPMPPGQAGDRETR